MWRRNIRPPAPCACVASKRAASRKLRTSKCEPRSSTTEYPANGSLSLTTIHHACSCVRPAVAPTRAGGIERINGQAARLISIGKLHNSRCVHIRPIDLVIFQEPLGDLRPGTSHLVEGFTLRCFQRFSLPHVATERYPWQDNSYTRGASIPVLSY